MRGLESVPAFETTEKTLDCGGSIDSVQTRLTVSPLKGKCNAMFGHGLESWESRVFVAAHNSGVTTAVTRRCARKFFAKTLFAASVASWAARS